MGREIRHVPVNWEHPKDSRGVYKPLMDNYIDSLGYWKERVEEFISKMTEIITTGKTIVYKREFTDVKKLYDYYTEDRELNPPNIELYIPEGPWFQLYENVSDGTPLSPPFSTKEGLIEWLTNNPDYWGNQWTKAQAEGILKCEYAPSLAMIGNKLYNSAQAAELQVRMEGEKK